MKRFTLLGTVLLLGGGMAMTQDDSGDIFKKLDKNSDGKLVASEIGEDQARFFDRLVRIGDDNDDGELSRAEFDSATSDKADEPRPVGREGARPDGRGPGPGRPEGGRGDAGEFLKRMDRNNDGKLTLNELPEFIRDRVAPVFKAAGKDALTFEEFMQARQKLGGPRRPGEGRPDGDGDRPRRDGERREGDRPPGRPGDGPPGGGPAFFRILDANRDGRLSRDELAKAVSLIDELDQNDDGQLDGRELFGGRPGEGRPPREGDRPPRDGEGRPDDRPRRPEGEGDRPRRPPAEGDRPKGDRRREGGGGNNLEENFRRLDQNGDGSVSKEEAPNRLKENFSRVDTNGDGKVTIEELRKIFDRARDGDRKKSDR